MRKSGYVSLWLLWVAVLAVALSPGQSGSARKDMATFVIEGKVVDVTQIAGKGISVATIQVSNARRTPPSIGSLPEGQNIRVILQNAEKLNKGSAYIFYATGAAASDLITLREIAHGPILPANVLAFTAIEPDVVQHYISADVLLRARVLATPPTASGGTSPASFPNEHAPQYKRVSLQVDEIVRGQLQHPDQRKLDVLVSTNPDIAYASASGQIQSDVEAGSTKIFALTWNPKLNSYVAVDRADVRPLSELQEIKSAVHLADSNSVKTPK